jgi:hypothetical protein
MTRRPLPAAGRAATEPSTEVQQSLHQSCNRGCNKSNDEKALLSVLASEWGLKLLVYEALSY